MSAAELAVAMEVFNLTNTYRQANGRAALTWSDLAAQSAYEHSVDMEARGFFDHVNPDGADPGNRLTGDGIVWSTFAENILMGFPAPTAATAMTQWIASPGHNANLLITTCTQLGVGVHDGPGGRWFTQVFYNP